MMRFPIMPLGPCTLPFTWHSLAKSFHAASSFHPPSHCLQPLLLSRYTYNSHWSFMPLPFTFLDLYSFPIWPISGWALVIFLLALIGSLWVSVQANIWTRFSVCGPCCLLAYSSKVKKEAQPSFKALPTFYQTTWRHI
jgi:hypothetical protein